MKYFNAAALAVAFLLGAVSGATNAAERVPVEAFAISDALSSPRLSPDGKHVAVSADMSDGHHAIVVYQVNGMQQTALLRLPRYQMPMEVLWADDERLLVATGRKIGAREKPVATGDIIASDYDGKNQRFIFGWDVIRPGVDRGWG